MLSSSGKGYNLSRVRMLVDCVVEDPLPDMASVTSTTVTYGDSVTYSCESGYEPVGENPRVCGLAGLWSAPPPVCQSE